MTDFINLGALIAVAVLIGFSLIGAVDARRIIRQPQTVRIASIRMRHRR